MNVVTLALILVFNVLHDCSMCLGEGNGTPLQYSCLENPMGKGAWSCKESDMTEQLKHHHHLLDKSRCMNT